MVIPDDENGAHPPSVWGPVEDQLAVGRPAWFPFGTAVVSEWQIAQLEPPVFDDLPTEATAFDRLGRTGDRSRTLVHSYVADWKIRRLAAGPHRYVATFEDVWGVTSPDFSIAADMPTHRRIDAVWWNRALGAFYQSRGIRVIPHVRWCDSRDYEYCFLGVKPGSAVAVSNHGCWRDGMLRHGFVHGVQAMIERLEPSTLFLYGTMDHSHLRGLARRTKIVHMEVERTRARKGAR